MTNLKAILKNKLKNSGKIAVLGIGSDLRGDDAAGMLVARKLKAYIKKNKIKSLKAFLGETAPENLTGEIKKFKPTHLLMIDAVELGKKAGAVEVLDSYQETGASFSTHKMPMHIMQDYLYKSFGCKSIIIGIQPETIVFGQNLSVKVQKCIEKLSEEMIEVLK